MATETLNDFNADASWKNIVATIAEAGGVDVIVQNLDNDGIQVVFEGGSQPVGRSGTALALMDSVKGNASAIWVRSNDGAARISVTLV